MRLEGIHHVTCITGDGPRNVEFYARVMGLRLSKKTVNQDDPTAYHLFFTDEQGSHGSDLTFFEYPGSTPGRAGAGMIHTIVYRVGSEDSLAFWEERLAGEGVPSERSPGRLRFQDPEGLGLELVVVETTDEPLIAFAADVPDEHALQGFDAVRAYVANPTSTERLLRDFMGFQAVAPHDWEARGESRGGHIALEAIQQRGTPGAGTVHHVAWASPDEEHAEWRKQVESGGMHATDIIDRFYFRSIYFREPNGILFEIATEGPGFTADEPLESLGEKLSLPPAYEQLRPQLEPILTPLPDTRKWRRAGVPSS
ncbi:MAG TPA: VOC family protein [Thermoleophilaceae bacterium]